MSLTSSTSPSITPRSTASSSTVRRSYTNKEKRSHHFVTLYNICLDASANYLFALRRHQHLKSWKARHYHPYSRPHPEASRHASLMDNISMICTYMWRKARSDGMAPHRAEAKAVRVMRDLYAWGQLLVQGFQDDENEDEDEEMDEGETEEGWDGEESLAMMVGQAAKRLCSELRDWRAWGVCDDITTDLRDLEREGGLGSASII